MGMTVIDMNKRWGDLANKMGTFAEDIVAPAVPFAIRKNFGFDVSELSVRREKTINGKTREYDVIAVADNYLFLVDVKSTYRSEYLKHFEKLLNDLKLFFPEYNEYVIVPVIASMNLSKNIVKSATNKNWLALHMMGDYMDFVNKENVSLNNQIRSFLSEGTVAIFSE